jgi:hypothetical protein
MSDFHDQVPGEPVHESQEVLVFRHYTGLGRQIRDLQAERENIRDTEIERDMEEGVLFGEGDAYLRFEFVNKVSFDFQAARAAKSMQFDAARAYAAGDISEEVWQSHQKLTPEIPDDVWDRRTSVEIQRKIMERSFKDDAARQAELQLVAAIATLVKELRKK